MLSYFYQAKKAMQSSGQRLYPSKSIPLHYNHLWSSSLRGQNFPASFHNEAKLDVGRKVWMKTIT